MRHVEPSNVHAVLQSAAEHPAQQVQHQDTVISHRREDYTCWMLASKSRCCSMHDKFTSPCTSCNAAIIFYLQSRTALRTEANALGANTKCYVCT
jgi:hypothetical protein